MVTDPLTATFSALADPTRRAILARLASGEATVTELAEPFAMSLPAVSKHLRVLEGAGLITRSRTAQWRPCRLDAAPLKDAQAWLERYSRFWNESLDRLAALFEETPCPTSGKSPASNSSAISRLRRPRSSRPGRSRKSSRIGSGRTGPKS
ncbi:MAG TPA: metalloregulator ArsR/SmtB family transcription factor [Hyphomicrobiaceae bacterium]|nr:metalloregulator ArsR/SmtB family transcription factor [Hyphomicrobiaceae bacterium]